MSVIHAVAHAALLLTLYLAANNVETFTGFGAIAVAAFVLHYLVTHFSSFDELYAEVLYLLRTWLSPTQRRIDRERRERIAERIFSFSDFGDRDLLNAYAVADSNDYEQRQLILDEVDARIEVYQSESHCLRFAHELQQWKAKVRAGRREAPVWCDSDEQQQQKPSILKKALKFAGIQERSASPQPQESEEEEEELDPAQEDYRRFIRAQQPSDE